MMMMMKKQTLKTNGYENWIEKLALEINADEEITLLCDPVQARQLSRDLLNYQSLPTEIDSVDKGTIVIRRTGAFT